MTSLAAGGHFPHQQPLQLAKQGLERAKVTLPSFKDLTSLLPLLFYVDKKAKISPISYTLPSYTMKN